MRKKFLLCLAALLALWGIGTTAAAAPVPGLGSYLQVTGYDPPDRLHGRHGAGSPGRQRLRPAGGGHLRTAAESEDRNPAAGHPHHSYFTDYTTAAEILAAIERDRQPSPATPRRTWTCSPRLIYAEGGCTWIPDWVQRMVGSVVLNRVESEYYPDTIREVIYQPGQYAPTWTAP